MPPASASSPWSRDALNSPWRAATTWCSSSAIFTAAVITALADQAAGVAVTSGLPKGRIGVTVEIKVNFLSPADGSELIARAKTLKMSGSIGVATVEVFSRKEATETLCAFCTATMRALDLPAEFR